MVRYILIMLTAVSGVFVSAVATGAQTVTPVTYPTTIETHGTLVHAFGGTNYMPSPAAAPAPDALTTQTAPAAQAVGPGGVPLDVLARTNPAVQVTRGTLPADVCTQITAQAAAKGVTLPGSDPCAYIHYSYGINHQVLPSGAQTGIPGAASSPSISPLAMDPGYWYWSFWDEVSDITGGIVWKFHLNEDGDANGLHVYQWHVNCTPSGLGTSVTWCGYLYNGGGAPYYGMQFGLNGTICIGINPVQVCYNHGMRRWIDDNGNPSTFYYW